MNRGVGRNWPYSSRLLWDIRGLMCRASRNILSPMRERKRTFLRNRKHKEVGICARRVSFTLAAILALAAITAPTRQSAQDRAVAPRNAVKPFPEADFVLRGRPSKRQRPRTVLGPIESDGKGGSKGTFAVYGSLPVEISTITFGGNGKLLAVGYTPGFVDLWDVENHKKLRTLEGGTAVALTRDGTLLAKDGEGIEFCEVSTGRLERRIPRPHKFPDNTIQEIAFNPSGTLLRITANSEDDTIYDVGTGKLVANLVDTKHARFSQDGSLLVGGNYQHLNVWSTRDWTKLHDFPNGPGYVTAIAVSPGNDVVVVGTSKLGRLLRLGSGEEVARIADGYTNFAEFSTAGFLFTLARDSFSVWDPKGRKVCVAQNLASPALALSPDDRWLAAAEPGEGVTIALWDLNKAMNACGISDLRPRASGGIR